MKLHVISASIAGCLLLTVTGCDKDSSKTAVDETKKAAESTANSVQKAAETVASEKPAEAITAVKAAEAQATQMVADKAAPVADTVSGVIAKAQSQVTEKKYQDALVTLGTLKDVKLTDTQQKLVAELKAQIQKLMTAEAGNAVGNLLKK